MVSYGTLYSFGVFFKPVLDEFGWTRAATSGAYSLCFLLAGVGGVATGGLSDKFGSRKLVTACGFFLGLGFILMYWISAIWQLYLFYVGLVGIGMSSVAPLLSATARWFDERRGLMAGIVVSGIGAGTVIMPPVASSLISNYGWRMSYVIVGAIALVLIVVAAQFLRRAPSEIGQLLDNGSEVKQVGLVPEAGEFSFWRAIRTGRFWIYAGAVSSMFFCQQIMIVHMVPFATDLEISPISAASIVSVIGGLSIAGRIGMGSASDRIGNKLSLVIVLVLVSVSLFWLLLAKELWMLYLFAIVFGFAYGGLVALNTPVTAELFGLSSLGAILGMVIFVSSVGGAIGPIVAGRIFDTSNSYQMVFVVCAGVSVAGVILAALLRPSRAKYS